MADDHLTSDFLAGSSAPRLRAPRRQDVVKKQVSVPVEVWEQLKVAAARVGGTPNDMLVRLASRGILDLQRAEQTRQVADERWRAFRSAEQAAPEGAVVPSAHELVEAADAFGRSD